MPCSCSVDNCGKKREKGVSGISFHQFPSKNQDLLKQWLEAAHKEGWKPTNNDKICSLHFTPDSFEKSGARKKLKNDAVPTIFNFPEEPEKKKPTKNGTGESSKAKKPKKGEAKKAESEEKAETNENGEDAESTEAPEEEDAESSENTKGSKDEKNSEEPEEEPAAKKRKVGRKNNKKK